MPTTAKCKKPIHTQLERAARALVLVADRNCRWSHRAARSGKLRMCVAHGGGRRCEEPGCNRAARARSGGLCAKHQSQAINVATPTVADDDSGLFDDYLGPELLSTDDAAFA